MSTQQYCIVVVVMYVLLDVHAWMEGFRSAEDDTDGQKRAEGMSDDGSGRGSYYRVIQTQ